MMTTQQKIPLARRIQRAAGGSQEQLCKEEVRHQLPARVHVEL